jgi:hypothetical protein
MGCQRDLVKSSRANDRTGRPGDAMIDIKTETTLLVSEVPNHPSLQREPRLHQSTILRWIHRGVLGTGGQRVKLEAFRLGGRWYTSLEALQRYAARLSGEPAATPKTEAEKLQNAQAANAALEQLGY